MKTLKLDLDRSWDKSENPMTQNQIWENFVIAGARSTYKDGGNLKLLSQLLKIVDSVKSAHGQVELEDADFDIIKEIGEKGKFDPAFCRIGSQILARIEEVK